MSRDVTSRVENGLISLCGAIIPPSEDGEESRNVKQRQAEAVDLAKSIIQEYTIISKDMKQAYKLVDTATNTMTTISRR